MHTVPHTDGGFVAEWEYVADESGEGPASSQGEAFSPYADALGHLEETFEEPLTGKGS